jgi:hypothetical protein
VQAQIRGHLVRKQYTDFILNNSIKYRHPAKYFTHLCIKEVVQVRITILKIDFFREEEI